MRRFVFPFSARANSINETGIYMNFLSHVGAFATTDHDSDTEIDTDTDTDTRNGVDTDLDTTTETDDIRTETELDAATETELDADLNDFDDNATLAVAAVDHPSGLTAFDATTTDAIASTALGDVAGSTRARVAVRHWRRHMMTAFRFFQPQKNSVGIIRVVLCQCHWVASWFRFGRT